MDYEKKYNNVVNKFAYLLESTDLIKGELRQNIESIFPELKESEDEKVKKALIEYFKDLKEKADHVNRLGFAQEDFVDVNGYGISDFISWLEKQGSTKWCDEDEKQIRQIERIVKDSGGTPKLQEQIHNWFEKIRPQVYWKPSKEQIVSFEATLLSMHCNRDKEIMFGLLEQLKRL